MQIPILHAMHIAILCFAILLQYAFLCNVQITILCTKQTAVLDTVQSAVLCKWLFFA